MIKPILMTPSRSVIAMCFVITAMISAPAAAPAQAPASDAQPLRVMSFNLRYATPEDGDDSWKHRRELTVDVIESFSPDLLGVQECRPRQGAYLREQLPGYTFFGIGREGGNGSEMVAVLYRSERFETVDRGYFWLSETPGEPGSKGWDAQLARPVVWAQLKPRDGGASFVLVNTHFDHRGPQARLESAGLIRRRLANLAPDAPAILTGDFNAEYDAEPYLVLANEEPEVGPALVDVVVQIHGEPSDASGTYHGFDGYRDGPYIDWILASPAFEVLEANIDHTHAEGNRYPSDHYPITAVLRRQP